MRLPLLLASLLIGAVMASVRVETKAAFPGNAAVTKSHSYDAMVTLMIENADGSTTPSGWSTRKENGGDGNPFAFTPGRNLIEVRASPWRRAAAGTRQGGATGAAHGARRPLMQIGSILHHGGGGGRASRRRQAAHSSAPTPYPTSLPPQGWTAGVLQMREGERALIHVPSAQGYGASPQGSKGGAWYIPGNSNLLFDVRARGWREGGYHQKRGVLPPTALPAQVARAHFSLPPPPPDPGPPPPWRPGPRAPPGPAAHSPPPRESS